MLFYPERIAIAGVLCYLFLWILAPLDPVFTISWGPLACYIAICYLAFIFGVLAISGGSKKVTAPQDIFRKPSNAFWIAAFLGAAGMSLRLYDKFYIRGISLANSAIDSRDLLGDTDAGPLAAVGGLLYPFCYIPLIIWWSSKSSKRRNKFRLILAVIIFALPGLDALTLLSRSQMLVALSTMYFAAACTLYKGRATDRRLMIPVLSGFALLISITIVAFATRLSEMNLDLLTSILNSAYGYVLTPNSTALSLMNGDGAIQSLISSIIPVLQYYLHGLFEFGLLWNRPDGQTFTMGLQTFDPYVKALSVFGLMRYPDYDFDVLYIRSGVFSTFFGPLWVDFGWIGPLFMASFGMLAKKVAKLARSGQVAALPLHCYLSVIIFFMPVVNFMISATGMYIINAFLMFLLFSNKSKPWTRISATRSSTSPAT